MFKLDEDVLDGEHADTVTDSAAVMTDAEALRLDALNTVQSLLSIAADIYSTIERANTQTMDGLLELAIQMAFTSGRLQEHGKIAMELANDINTVLAEAGKPHVTDAADEGVN